MPTPERLKPDKGIIIGGVISFFIWGLSVAACIGSQVDRKAALADQENFSSYRSAHTYEGARLRTGQ